MDDLKLDLDASIMRLIEELNNLKQGVISEGLFRKENINYYQIDFSSFSKSIDNITYHLNLSRKIIAADSTTISQKNYEYIKNELSILSEHLVWMSYDGRKPTKEEIEEQVRSYLSLMSLKAFNFYKRVQFVFEGIAQDKNMLIYFNDELTRQKQQADKTLQDISAIGQRVKSQSTIEVYDEEMKNYRDSVITYQAYFYITSSIFLVAVFIFTFGHSFDFNNNSDVFRFIYFKVTFCVIFAVLITHFLRLAAFFRKKHEEARRTLLELKALPSFVQGMSEGDILKIRKELVPCYFGRRSDNDSLDKLGDDLDNKIKIISDLLVAATGIMKESVKGNEANNHKKNDSD